VLRQSAVSHPSVLERELQLVRFDARATSSPARAIPLTAVIRFEIILESGRNGFSTPSPLAHAKLAFASDLRSPNGI
jgi:hypothetical protein